MAIAIIFFLKNAIRISGSRKKIDTTFTGIKINDPKNPDIIAQKIGLLREREKTKRLTPKAANGSENNLREKLKNTGENNASKNIGLFLLEE